MDTRCFLKLKLCQKLNKNHLIANSNNFEKQDRHYFKPTDKELYQNFKKAIPSIVIDEAIRLREANRIKEEKIKELKSEKDKRISSLEEKMEQVTKLLELAIK